MSDFSAFLLKEIKRFNSPRNLVVWSAFLIIVLVFVNMGVNNHKKISEKEEKFRTIQSNYFDKTTNYEGYGRDGIKVLFIPSHTEVLFRNTVIPPDMAAKIDNIVSVDISSNLKGKSLSPASVGGRLDFSNLILLLGTIFALFYGYESLYHKEYLKLLVSLRSHKKIFVSIIISRSLLFIAAFILLFFVVLLFLAVRGIDCTAADYAALSGSLVSTLAMLLFFFTAGVFFGTFRSTLVSAIAMFTTWFFLIFIIPGLINAAVEKKFPDITRDYQTELSKYAKLVEFENKTEKKLGKFNRDNIEAEQKNIIDFYNIDYKEIEALETRLKDEIAAAVHTYYTLSAWTPVTSYQSTCGEVSSRGYMNFLDFYKYVIELKMNFVWFFIQRTFFNDPKIMVSFIKKDENIFRAGPRLPPNYTKALIINLFYTLLLFMVSLFRSKKALFPLPEKANAYDDLRIGLETGTQYTFYIYYPEVVHQFVNVFFAEGKTLDWQITIDNQDIVSRKKKTDFLYLPNGSTLPGDLKPGHLLSLFKRLANLPGSDIEKARQALGKEVLKKRLANLEIAERAGLLLTLAEMVKGKIPVLVFNDFISGIPAFLREGLSERGERLKSGQVSIVDMTANAAPWLDADITSSIVLKDGKYKVV